MTLSTKGTGVCLLPPQPLTRNIYAEWVSWRKLEVFSLFLPGVMKNGGMGFIGTAIIAVAMARYINESK